MGLWILFGFLPGVVAGAATAHAWLTRRQARERDRFRSQAEAAAEVRIAELKQQYEIRLHETALTGERLKTQLEALLPQVAESVLAAKAGQLRQIAEGDLKLLGQQTVHQVTESQHGLEAVVKVMSDQLAEYQQRIQAFETERALAQGRLQEQIALMAQTGVTMAQEARTLRQALAVSGGVRGRWGEAVLKNLLERCGLNQNVDYELQPSLDAGGEQRLRPDAIVRLPSGRRLVIDAKASLAPFVAGLESEDAAERQARFAEFAQGLRKMARDLAGRSYSEVADDSLPYIVMFVPSEVAFRAAADSDPGLFQYGQELKPQVLLASPSTLAPLILLVRDGWTEQRATQQMRALLDEVQEFGRRVVKFYGHVARIGEKLDAAVHAYNEAAGSYRQRLLPSWERAQSLGAGWGDRPQVEEIARLPAGEPRMLGPRKTAAGGGEP